MKKTVFLSLILIFLIAAQAFAQMDKPGSQVEQVGKDTKIGEAQKMPVMQCPKMQMMQGHGMMQGQQMQMMHCQDMIQIVTSLVSMQEKIILGIKPEEKDKMIQDLKEIRDKLENMSNICKCMMSQPPLPQTTAPETPASQIPAPSEHKH
jgi:hypothetical protein